MVLKELINSIDMLAFTGAMDIPIMGLSCDSRIVQSGDLFIAIRGFETDGHLFWEEAAKKGAFAIVIEDEKIWNNSSFKRLADLGISLCLVPNSRLATAIMADRFYGHPSRNLHLIGVTGTNGKTTTCTLISKILESSGEQTGSITTIDYRIGQEILHAVRTTPESLYLQQFFSKILDRGLIWAVLEVSSHSLVLDRVMGCWFDAVVLTNITQDHMDFHKTKEEYVMAKARLFEILDNVTVARSEDKIAVLNVDDPDSRKIAEEKLSKGFSNTLKITYGLDNKADVTAKDIKEESCGLKFIAATPWGDLSVESSLIGKPNIYNILAAISVTMGFGIDSKDILKGIKAVSGVPGRFEKIILGQPFEIIIDYAHTDDALFSLLSTLRKHARGRLICVFGCGGDRDRSKRPLMGKVAARLSDLIILTSDNPRGEDPLSIIKEIEGGIPKEGAEEMYEICPDRKEAIYRAISLARADDVVVIAGKGHETTQVIGSKAFPFDDREIVRQAVNDSAWGVS